ncbi:hypothetical protein [Mycolicibacterium palauense]|uniref:hypothetical protein n=1 Tax=Mycolicibacterium palauense TaxID=2034511 RepID=UPI000BFF0773|nr:hypothetical protein [Mycolicibacterium palauense]
MQINVTGRPLRRSAECECGWTGKAHWLRASAVVDAGMHAAESGHLPVVEYTLSMEPREAVLQAS